VCGALTYNASVDTIAHGLTGALIGYAGFRQRGGRAALWTAIAASEFPDADIVLALISGETYLQWHRGPTHSMLMLPLWSALVAWVFWMLAGRKNFRLLWAASAAGMASHLFLDWITSYGTMLLSPLNDARFALSWVFIVDPYVWAMLLVALIAAIRTQHTRIARSALGALLAYFLFCGIAHFHATYVARIRSLEMRVAAYPQPLNPFRWTIVSEAGDTIHWRAAGHNDTFTQFRDDKLLPQAEATDVVKLFRWFAEFPVVEKREEGERTILRYRDLRFRSPMPGGSIREGTFVVAEVEFDRQGKLLAAKLIGARE
jgi:membrane-bound metal-dependent hydrolase YbcI (DUF457 family)